MAKPKNQKQGEAISRKRDYFRKHAYPKWQKYQPGGDFYKHTETTEGKAQADKEARLADAELYKAAKEAQVDCHGNAIV